MELRKACQAIANITALNKGDYSCGQCQSLTCRKSGEVGKVVRVVHLFAFTVTLAILVYDPASANGTWKSPETGDCPAKAGVWGRNPRRREAGVQMPDVAKTGMLLGK
jgi:hypothetical protein